jgi:hypothetical protein
MRWLLMQARSELLTQPMHCRAHEGIGSKQQQRFQLSVGGGAHICCTTLGWPRAGTVRSQVVSEDTGCATCRNPRAYFLAAAFLGAAFTVPSRRPGPFGHPQVKFKVTRHPPGPGSH